MLLRQLRERPGGRGGGRRPPSSRSCRPSGTPPTTARPSCSASFADRPTPGFWRWPASPAGRCTSKDCSWDPEAMAYVRDCRSSGGNDSTTVGLPCGPTGIAPDGTPCREKLKTPRVWEGDRRRRARDDHRHRAEGHASSTGSSSTSGRTPRPTPTGTAAARRWTGPPVQDRAHRSSSSTCRRRTRRPANTGGPPSSCASARAWCGRC